MGRHAKPKVRKNIGKRLLARATAVVTFATGSMLADASTAAAHNGHIHVAGVNGYGGLALRSAPNTNASVHQRLQDGQGDGISFLCIAEGEQVDGLLSTNKWAKVWVPRQDGTQQEGYISLAYTDLLQSELGDMQAAWNIPGCDAQPQASSLFTERRARDTPNDAPVGRNYGPDHGAIEAVEDGTNSRITFRFSLTQKQIDNLRSIGDYLEIDFAMRGYAFPVSSRYGWDGYRVETNLPGAVHDVSFTDTNPYEQFPGVTGVGAAELHAGTDYFVTLRWNGDLSHDGLPAVNIVWTASRWARGWVPLESISCNTAGPLSGNEKAWCVFPVQDGYSVIGEAKTPYGRLLYPEYSFGFVPIGQLGKMNRFTF